MSKAVARGFTLIEILMVIALFAAGAVVLLQIFSMGLYGSVDNENTMIATALAQEKMEMMRNVPYASVLPEARAQVPNYTSFDREVLVATPVSNLKQVTVNIYWDGKAGDVKISLVTYVSNII
ncbi:MAG: type II secretion system protein [Candidatus Omnitrophica bacterium]|nr:type II secretion system protein [Candidatus Omnitrophota bacterium]